MFAGTLADCDHSRRLWTMLEPLFATLCSSVIALGHVVQLSVTAMLAVLWQ